LQWAWEFLNHFTAQQAVDFVQSYNPKTKLALPFTPQPSVRTDLKYNLKNLKRLKDFYLEINHQYHFAASGPSRIDRSERPTPAYQLLGLGLGSKFQLGAQSISLNCQVKNIFDTAYLSHLSRYRLIDIPEQGRNFVLTLKMDIGGKIN